MRRWLLLLVLAGCSPAPVPPPPRPPVPAALASCPHAPPAPLNLPMIVTTDRLRQGFQALQTAREDERRRGDSCADKLDRLNLWIKQHP